MQRENEAKSKQFKQKRQRKPKRLRTTPPNCEWTATTVGQQRPIELTAEVSEPLKKNFTSLAAYNKCVVHVCVLGWQLVSTSRHENDQIQVLSTQSATIEQRLFGKVMLTAFG